ncbi:hypothetical protein BKA56DRAFT_661032 [Ilyonectria sp. MPI-CAGE-AT-0026]|nr:hypothetical protein BKA56DRAFT_661032 [Ilyonectria sp. MPI-CAGE-AT-0026]
MKVAALFTIFYAVLATALVLPREARGVEKMALKGPATDIFSRNREVTTDAEVDFATSENGNEFEKRSKEDLLQCNVGNPGVGGAGDQNALIDGIDYLNQKWGDAVWVVEPNSCKRVSCSWNSAIWVCSDAKDTLQAKTKDVTALATLIIDNCIENTLMAIWTHGRAYHNQDWNVILGKDKC